MQKGQNFVKEYITLKIVTCMYHVSMIITVPTVSNYDVAYCSY